MLIHALNTLEWPGKVESSHAMSPTLTGLPTLLVRCSLAQKHVIHASQILVSLGGCLTEELAIQTVNQPSPWVCPRPTSVVVEKLWGDQGPVIPEGYPCFSNADVSLVDTLAQSYEHG